MLSIRGSSNRFKSVRNWSIAWRLPPRRLMLRHNFFARPYYASQPRLWGDKQTTQGGTGYAAPVEPYTCFRIYCQQQLYLAILLRVASWLMCNQQGSQQRSQEVSYTVLIKPVSSMNTKS